MDNRPYDKEVYGRQAMSFRFHKWTGARSGDSSMRQRSFATILVGKSALLREGITQILSAAADFHIVASAACVNDSVLTSLPRQQSILLIIAAGDDLDSASGQFQLFKSRHPSARVAVLADHAQAVDMVSAFRAGANAFFIKVAHCDAFIKSLELVMLGETILPMEILSTTIFDRADDDEHDHEYNSVARPIKNTTRELLGPQSGYTPRLSARQRCILDCLIEGHSNKVIARKIDIAEATVKVHIKSILRKIGVRNRTQAAIWAMSNGSPISTADDSSCTPPKADLRPPLGSHLIRTLPVTQQGG
jgi:DNA-binding NarL/FixJ family response regulator